MSWCCTRGTGWRAHVEERCHEVLAHGLAAPAGLMTRTAAQRAVTLCAPIPVLAVTSIAAQAAGAASLAGNSVPLPQLGRLPPGAALLPQSQQDRFRPLFPTKVCRGYCMVKLRACHDGDVAHAARGRLAVLRDIMCL